MSRRIRDPTSRRRAARLARVARAGIVGIALVVGTIPFASMSAAGNQTIVIVDFGVPAAPT